MKKATMGILALLLVGIVATGALAFRGNPNRAALETGDYEAYRNGWQADDRPGVCQPLSEEQFAQRSERFQQREQLMDTAIDEGYDAWLEAMESMDHPPRITELITEENWDTFVAHHEAMEEGDFETARELAEELGIGPGMGQHMGHHRGG